MSIPDRGPKRRARRIAADEAHAWARNLRLGNMLAKMVLSMSTLYVDGDGYCFVSIPTLADDCEMSSDTVRKRLHWLEQIGAITRIPQWIDENGCRNGDARGKRTSDLIRLMIDADQDAIEARARGYDVAESSDNSVAFSPGPQQGLNSGLELLGPRPALGQPSHCGKGLNSEPEPESPPKAPSGGQESAAPDWQEKEPDDFGPSWSSYPGHEVMRRDLALAEFRLLTPEKQRLCRAAIPLFATSLIKLKRSSVPNFHLWIRSRGFDEFPDAKLPDAAPARRWVCGDELAGLMVATRMARRHPRLMDDPERGRGLWVTVAERPDLAALAVFHDDNPELWQRVDVGTAQFASWRDRLKLWLGGEIEPERIWIEPYDAAVHGLPVLHKDFRLRKSVDGLRVPAPWPPRRDGTWQNDNSEEA